MTALNGFCEPEFRPVQDAFMKGFDDGLEVGASIAVFREGEPVVDLWAGFKDAARTEPWEEDSITMVASTSKIFTHLCAAILIDQGKLDPEAPVVDYWPGFGRHGKENTLVRHCFNHMSCVPGFDPPVPFSDTYNWDDIIRDLEEQQPWWESGTRLAYHGETFGFLIGELVRRISGQTPGVFLRENITSKVDADFHIGLPEQALPRFVATIPPEDEGTRYEPGSIGDRIMNCYIDPYSDPVKMLTSEIPGSTGAGNARSIAKLGAIYANHGELNGQRFLSKETLDYLLQEQVYDMEEVFEMKLRFGLGLGLNSEEFPCPSDQTLHWGGYGGSICIMDLASKTSLAYVPNNFIESIIEDPRNAAIRRAYNGVVG
jgi:CubicO group peptidase (beta-lactamase class C family)